jgi:hypothetical protein
VSGPDGHGAGLAPGAAETLADEVAKLSMRVSTK